jgi:hypothetical protein
MRTTVTQSIAVLGSLLIFLALAIPAEGYSPAWLQEHMQGRLKISGLYHGVGFAAYQGDSPDYDTLKLAKDRALDELCYQLSVSIQSELTDRIVKKGGYEEQQIASSLLVSSRKVLSGVKEKQRWTDPKHRRHWVLLTIEKRSADEQLQQQKFVNAVIDRLENKQQEITEGIQRITRLLEQQTALYRDQMNHYGDLLEKIDSKVGAATAQTRQDYDVIRQSILTLEQSQKNISSQQTAQIAALMQQNRRLQEMVQRITENIQKDYFLTLAEDDLQTEALNPEFRVRIEPDKGPGATYTAGEKIRFHIEASRGCYIKVIYLSSTANGADTQKRMNTLLFPNIHDRDNWIRGGVTTVIGRYGELEIEPPFGQDVITVVASERQFNDIDNILKDARNGYYSEMTTNTRGALQVRTRGITVAKPGGGSMLTEKTDEVKVASDTCFIVSRPKP